MNFKIIAGVLIALIIEVSVIHGQSTNSKFKYAALRVGDMMPNLVLSPSVSDNGYNRKLLDFRGKLLIIDFWATWCGSCISNFYKLEKLKKEFGNALDIVMVTEENENTVKTFINRRKRFTTSGLPFPSICGDSVLKYLFPHETLPQYAWIDSKGKVRAVTGPEEVNAKNIRGILNEQPIRFKTKSDAAQKIFHDEFKPLFINGNGGNGDAISWYSVLSGETAGLQNSGIVHLRKQGGFVQVTNASIRNLYKIAYNDDPEFLDGRLENSRLILKVNDSSKYIATYSGTKLVSGKLYCYNLITPKISKDALRRCIQEDLHRYFGLKARWEKRMMKCLVISADDTTLIGPVSADYYKNKSTWSSDYNYVLKGGYMKYFRISLISSFLFYSPYPILDETNSRGRANFDIEADMSDWRSIDKALGKYKMHLQLKDRMVNVLVLEE